MTELDVGCPGLPRMRQISFVSLILISLAASARADTDAFLSAVMFALTGSDKVTIQIVDRPNCVFLLTTEYGDGKIVGETYHLNNVDVDRIKIEQWHNSYSQWIQTELHGDSVVYERRLMKPGALLPKSFPNIDLPSQTSSNSTTLTIYSNELERLSHAWKYVYSHGCKGKKSPF
jgi:hypothetical protein